MLAYSREEVDALKRQDGALRKEVVIQTERGLRPMAPGDRVTFLRNDRTLGVTNGTLGTVERASGSSLQVRLDDEGHSPKRGAVDLTTYRHLDHGYAVTVHKSQGQTVDHSYLLASGLWDRHAAYVGLTRHRHSTQLHYDTESFTQGEPELTRRLSRSRHKNMALDHVAPKARGKDRDTKAWKYLQSLPAQRREREVEKVRQDYVAAIREHNEAERVAQRKEQAAKDFVEVVEEVKAANETHQQAKKRYARLSRQEEVFRKDHPIRYALGQRPFDDKQAVAKAHGDALQAKKAYEACVRSPEVTAKARGLADSHNQKTRQKNQELPLLLEQLKECRERFESSKDILKELTQEKGAWMVTKIQKTDHDHVLGS